MMHRFGTRRTVAVLAVTGSLLAGGVAMATQSNAAPVTGPDGKIYQVNGYLGTKTVVTSGSGSWQRAWEECRKDPKYGHRVRGVKKFRSERQEIRGSAGRNGVLYVDDYFCSSSPRP